MTRRFRNSKGTDQRNLPNYTVAEASYWLALPENTVRNWLVGKSNMDPVLEPASRDPLAMSFWNVVECNVLAVIRGEHRIRLPQIRRAIQFVRHEMGKERPLIEQSFEAGPRELFVEHLGNLVSASSGGQIVARELLGASLKRVEWDEEGLAKRFSPWRRDPHEPQILSIDPTVAFGRPVLIRTSVPAGPIIDRYRAGESMNSISNDFGIERERVEDLIRLFVEEAA